MASSSITSWQTHGENGNSERLYFSWAPKSLQVVDCSHEMQRHLLLERKAMTSIDRILISKDITFLTKFHLVKAVVFSSSHVWMWELDYKESWASKNWCFWTVVLEKTLEIPLDCKEIQPVHPKGNQSWIFIGRTDAKAETPILWPPDAKNWIIWKDWCWERSKAEEKGMAEDEIVGWHHLMRWTWVWVGSGSWWLTGRLACFSPWGCKESDKTEWHNNNNHIT